MTLEQITKLINQDYARIQTVSYSGKAKDLLESIQTRIDLEEIRKPSLSGFKGERDGLYVFIVFSRN